MKGNYRLIPLAVLVILTQLYLKDAAWWIATIQTFFIAYLLDKVRNLYLRK